MLRAQDSDQRRTILNHLRNVVQSYRVLADQENIRGQKHFLEGDLEIAQLSADISV